jgi:chitinase
MKWLFGGVLGGVAIGAVTVFHIAAAGSRVATPLSTSTPSKNMWVTGFYVGYMAGQYPPAAIDFRSLTHLIVFAALPRHDATLDTSLFIDPVRGPQIARELAQRAHAAGRKAMLAVGGTNSAPGFRDAVAAGHLPVFVNHLLDIVNEWNFDGIDIDWEPLEPEDHESVLALLRALRGAKDGLILTADVGWHNSNFPMTTRERSFYPALAAAVDQMNVMTYGMADNWTDWAVWHSSALFGDGADYPTSVDATMRAYVEAGVARQKLGIGIGFYGSCWSAPAALPRTRPLQSHVVAGDNDMSFAVIKEEYYVPADYHFDDAAAAAYLSFLVPKGSKKCTFVSYEDEVSVAAKAAYARSRGLGGGMIWQLNEGFDPQASDPNSLLHAVGRSFLADSLPPSQ